MLDVHIDEFFRDCAVILLAGLRNFPRPQTLFVEDISGPDEMDEFGLHSNRYLSAFGTICWLREEGYIRFSGFDRQESVDDFVLTATALRRLLAPSRQSLKDNDTPTPLFQVLEYATLQADSIWITQLVMEQVFSRETLLPA
ncbi:hypothetical protein [Oceanobacter mangrovi]|uniref:hypothetical protein n=1 Tax=Oceanobacter mangrovi TaxID=2862510 RepID=UPI001C8E461B|nr:hypothetical protein [Oceanobacter mangrovi]